jgi:deoxycytidylate deaminase
MLINARISKLVYINDYRVDPIAMDFLEKANVTIEKYLPEES